jgi:hypothetical protein
MRVLKALSAWGECPNYWEMMVVVYKKKTRG